MHILLFKEYKELYSYKPSLYLEQNPYCIHSATG